MSASNFIYINKLFYKKYFISSKFNLQSRYCKLKKIYNKKIKLKKTKIKSKATVKFQTPAIIL